FGQRELSSLRKLEVLQVRVSCPDDAKTFVVVADGEWRGKFHAAVVAQLLEQFPRNVAGGDVEIEHGVESELQRTAFGANDHLITERALLEPVLHSVSNQQNRHG